MTVIEHLRCSTGLIGRAKLAALLGAHPQTIWTWTRDGKLPHSRIGNRLRFDPADVANWLERRQVS